MASTRIDKDLRGVGLYHTLFGSSNLSTADSTYTQTGPHAGGVGAPSGPTGSNSPVRGEVEGLGDQDAAVVVEALQGGNPGLARGMRVGYRLASESATQVRGWQPPNLITGCWSPAYGTTVMDSLDAVTLRNGKILAVYRNSSTGALNLQTWDPTTAAFTAETAPVSTCSHGVAIAVDSAGFIYVLCEQPAASVIAWSLYRSQSADTTADGWDEIARDPFDTDPVALTEKIRLGFLSTGDVVVTGWFRNAVTGSIKQWASTDGGATFTQISSTGNASATVIGDQVVTASGKLGLVRVTTGNVANWHSTAVAFQSALSVTAVQIGTSVREAWAAVDPSGRIYVWLLSSASTDQVSVKYSDDDGATWTAMSDGLTDFDADAGQFLTLGRAVTAMGDAFLFHKSSDNVGTNDGSPILTRCGGWSNSVVYEGGDPDNALGSGAGAEDTQAVWMPVSEPDDLAAWAAGGTGTDANDAFTAAGRLRIATVGVSRYYDAATAPTVVAGAWIKAEWQQRVTAGGALTTFDTGVSIRASAGAGANDASELRIWATTTQVSIRSSVGSVATITADMTTDMQFRAFVHEAGYAIVLYRRPYETTWTLAYESNTHANLTTATPLVRWGHGAVATTTSEFSYFHHVAGTTLPAIGPIVCRLFSTFSSFLGPMGKPITGFAMPLGAGSQGTSNQRVLHVRGKDGPAVLGDTWTITPRYDYPVEAIDPLVEPSPRITWRSTSTAENVIAWEIDPTYTTSLTRNIALGLFNANFPLAYLEAHDGVGWVAIGTWDSRIGTGLSYTRTGNTIRINGGAALTKYVKRHQLVGDVVDLGSSKYRRIIRHTEGIWSTAAGKHVELVLEGIDGSEPASGSALAIWAKSGVLVVHALSALYRRWRLRIPSQANADGYHRLGNVVPAELVVWGAQHSRGHGQRTDPNAASDETDDLVVRRYQLGPVRRVWTWAWPDGIDRSRLQDTSPTPDYLAHTATTEGIANINDVADQVAGLLADAKGGEVPVMCLPAIPTTSGTTLTDPRLFMFANMASNVGVENVLGKDGTSEVDRTAPLTFEEHV